MRLNGGVIGKATTEGMFGLPEHFVKTQDKTFTNNGIGWRLDKPVLNLEKNRPWFLKTNSTSGEGLWFDPTGHFMYVHDGDSAHSYYLNVPWSISSATWISKSHPLAADVGGTGIWGNPEGTRMYRCGTSANIYEFDVTNPYILSIDSMNSYGPITTYNSSDSTLKGLYIDATGTRMYSVSTNSDLVRYHSLSTAWDLSTATAISSFSVNSQDATPIGLFFKSDGTQMYMCGASTDKFYTYDLSTAWDITTATLTQTDVLFFPIGITGDMFFKPDGTRLYVNTTNGPTVFEFHCTTPWDISTASVPANNKWFSLGLQDVSAAGAASSTTGTQGGSFADSGNKFYITGSTSDKITRYDLSTPYEISSAVYHSQSVTLGDTQPTGIYMKEDGSKAYIIGNTNDQVREYTLTTNYDITSITETATTTSGLFTETAPQHVDFKPDGTAFYIVGTSSDTVETFNLSTAWDLTTATAGNTFSVASEENAPYTIAFKPDGTKMYIGGGGEDGYNQYSLSTAWDVSTATAEKIVHIIQGISPYSINFNDDGTKVTISDTTYDYAITVDLTTAWDLGSVVPWFEESYKLEAGYSATTSLGGLAVAGDGSRFYTTEGVQDKIYQYDMNTAWEVNTASYNNVVIDGGTHGAGNETNLQIINFSTDGYNMYTAGTSRKTIKQWTLTTAWDISTASDSGKYFETGLGTTYYMNWKEDGLRFFVSDSNSDTIKQFHCETAWDISTAYAVGYALEVGTNTSLDYWGMWMDSTGTKLFVADAYNDRVYEWELKEAWEIGTAVSTGVNAAINPTDTYLRHVWFKPDGLKVFMLGSYSRYLREYELTTPFDLTTMNTTQIASRDLGSVQPNALYFEPDGGAFWHIDNTYGRFVRTALSTNWDIGSVGTVSNSTTYSNANAAPYSTLMRDIHIGSSGNYLFAVDDGGQSPCRLHRFKMASAYSTSLTYSTTDANNPAQVLDLDALFTAQVPGNKTPQPKGLFFKPDGKTFYIVNSDTADGIYQFDLSVAWDLTSTVTHKSAAPTFPWANYGTTTANIDLTRGFAFDGRGESVYIANWQSNIYQSRYYRQIHKYDLNEAWDLRSGVTEDRKHQYEIGIEHGSRDSVANFKDFMFNKLGNKMYILDNRLGNDLKGSIFQYNLTAD